MKTAPIYSYSDFAQTHYGGTLYGVPLDLGMGCPHRHADGTGGCSFCPENGARSVILKKMTILEEQIQAGVTFARERYGATLFSAYLQAYSNTFASDAHFRNTCERILQAHPFKAIHLGTRPDCLSEKTLAWLRDLNQQLEVWMELGVQTAHDRTLSRINRGHDWACSRHAILRIQDAGLKFAPHVIVGLPGEGKRDFRHTIQSLATLGMDAIKIHNLHVLHGTQLAKEYAEAPFPVLNEHAYTDVLLDLLRYIPEDVPIMRLTTDSAPEGIIAPQWSMAKEQFRTHLFFHMNQRGIRQGDRCPKGASPQPARPSQTTYAPIVTQDGSVTFWSPHFHEHFHTPSGARSEAERKYIHPANLSEKLQKKDIRLLDICFGLGYNSLASCETAAIDSPHRLEITALEMDRHVVAHAAGCMQHDANTTFDWRACLHDIHTTSQWEHGQSRIRMIWGDARHTITQAHGLFDIIWLDAFSTQRNSELWTVDFFRKIKTHLAPDGVLLTYCSAIPVRAGLMEAGFFIGETTPFGRERGGTVAAHTPEGIITPIPQRDSHLIQTTDRGIPYRDPSGTRTNREILNARQMEILAAKANRTT